MNTALDEVTGLVMAGRDTSVLSAIRQPAVALAMWLRAVPDGLADWLDALPDESLPEGRVNVAPGQAVDALTAVCDATGTPRTAQREAMIDDWVGLIDRYAALLGLARVDVRVDRIRGAGCHRFHVDRVSWRLICPYRGAGTQWVPPAQGGAALDGQHAFQGPISVLPRFAVGLFRGSEAGGGLVHRSPPAGVVDRLLLCLNPISGVTPPPWRCQSVVRTRCG